MSFWHLVSPQNAALSREPERVRGEVAAVDELSRAGARSIENRAKRDFRACEQGLACGSRRDMGKARRVHFPTRASQGPIGLPPRTTRQTAPEAPR